MARMVAEEPQFYVTRTLPICYLVNYLASFSRRKPEMSLFLLALQNKIDEFIFLLWRNWFHLHSHSISSLKKKKRKKKERSQSVGFEPTLPEGIWFLVRRLNHSATTAYCNILHYFFSHLVSCREAVENRVLLGYYQLITHSTTHPTRNNSEERSSYNIFSFKSVNGLFTIL